MQYKAQRLECLAIKRSAAESGQSTILMVVSLGIFLLASLGLGIDYTNHGFTGSNCKPRPTRQPGSTDE